MSKGRNYLRYYWVNRAILWRLHGIIACFFETCCGSRALIHRGETSCRIGQLAHDMHAVQALGRVRCMAAGRRNCQWRQRFGNADDRQYGCACTPALCRCLGPQAIGRSRGGWTSKVHTIVDALIVGIRAAGATVVIPPKRNSLLRRSYDQYL